MFESVKNSFVLKEFSEEDKKYWFSLTEKAVSHHIDTLYYSAFLKDDNCETSTEGILGLLSILKEKKQQKLSDMSSDVAFFGMNVLSTGAAISAGMYMNHLQDGENFDIFISDYLPNNDTPRILVQLRTHSLVLDGLYRAIENSYEKLARMLDYYDIEISYVQENRIDYAFHCNLIQNPMLMFSDEKLSRHLVTKADEAWKHLWITSKKENFFDLDYLALGNRRSNNVFFRVYNKAKEVVQMNYKGFFFERWKERGIISNYDYYVYQKAYELKSFKVGVQIGRIDWYLEHGHNAELKAQLIKLKESCYIRNDNSPHIEKKLKGILPPVTVVLNFEFETKRKFYGKLDHFIDSYKCEYSGGYEKLGRLYKVLGLRREIIDRLMTKNVSFRQNRKDSESPELAFWHRLRTVRIEDQPDKPILDAYYTYSHNSDVRRTKLRLNRAIVTAAAMSRNSLKSSTYSEDVWEAITCLNDNDISESYSKFKPVLDAAEPFGYDEIQRRKKRQLRTVIREEFEETEEEKENGTTD